ncbi:DUF4174 domain-containing protein [[Leptolyngbya] sp. PCC 7376]|uniref:DUF4174 domain-containing protein n=1 Tax=[Leptolyngbya] sp. PCC 7376 TaxID=111781 RepID=UPI0013589AA1
MALSARNLYRYNSSDSDCAVVLIGKDGGTKLRSSTLINLNPIFSEIDSIPMRQKEMGEHLTKIY